MYHMIEFGLEVLADLEVPGETRLEQVIIKKGTRLQAQIKPHVVETRYGPVEVADLFFEDGSTARTVGFASFRFVDE